MIHKSVPADHGPLAKSVLRSCLPLFRAGDVRKCPQMVTPTERLTYTIENGYAHGCRLTVQEGLGPEEREQCQWQHEGPLHDVSSS